MGIFYEQTPGGVRFANLPGTIIYRACGALRMDDRDIFCRGAFNVYTKFLKKDAARTE
jgi:hypothetical protein